MELLSSQTSWALFSVRPDRSTQPSTPFGEYLSCEYSLCWLQACAALNLGVSLFEEDTGIFVVTVDEAGFVLLLQLSVSPPCVKNLLVLW